jgi:hypothetical protein
LGFEFRVGTDPLAIDGFDKASIMVKVLTISSSSVTLSLLVSSAMACPFILDYVEACHSCAVPFSSVTL